MLKVEFSRSALNEMIAAARFYDAVRPDYGALFLKNVSRAVEFIRTYPKSGTAIRSGTEIRRHLVKRFHHTVIYISCGRNAAHTRRAAPRTRA